jgi:hypothetical protein
LRARPAGRVPSFAQSCDQGVGGFRGGVEVVDVFAGEGGAEEGAGVFPDCAVAGEDRVAEEGDEGCAAGLCECQISVGPGVVVHRAFCHRRLTGPISNS